LLSIANAPNFGGCSVRNDELLLRAGQVIISSEGNLADPELCYCYALVMERRGYPRPQIIEYLTTALDKGFDPAWPLYHRGRLKLALGDRTGRDDLKRSEALGGAAGQEAKRALAADQGHTLVKGHAGGPIMQFRAETYSADERTYRVSGQGLTVSIWPRCNTLTRTFTLKRTAAVSSASPCFTHISRWLVC
jgi:hypothetical protein